MVVLSSRRARRLGLRDPVVHACAFRARSVHTVGLDRPIGIAWVSSDGVVTKRTLLKRFRLAYGRGPVVLETHDLDRLPDVGAQLTVLP